MLSGLFEKNILSVSAFKKKKRKSILVESSFLLWRCRMILAQSQTTAEWRRSSLLQALHTSFAWPVSMRAAAGRSLRSLRLRPAYLASLEHRVPSKSARLVTANGLCLVYMEVNFGDWNSFSSPIRAPMVPTWPGSLLQWRRGRSSSIQCIWPSRAHKQSRLKRPLRLSLPLCGCTVGPTRPA